MDPQGYFHDRLEGAEPFFLRFPIEDEVGPYWTETGALVGAEATDEEPILAVALGEHRYRLAEQCCGPFSCLRLHWGDEFEAELCAENVLILTQVVVPQPYRHFRYLVPPGFDGGHPLARLVDQLRGGWELIAGGMLTLTVPRSEADEFLSVDKSALLRGAIVVAD